MRIKGDREMATVLDTRTGGMRARRGSGAGNSAARVTGVGGVGRRRPVGEVRSIGVDGKFCKGGIR